MNSLLVALTLVAAPLISAVAAPAQASVLTVRSTGCTQDLKGGRAGNPYRVDMLCRPSSTNSGEMVLETVKTIYAPQGHCDVDSMLKRCQREEPVVTRLNQLSPECHQLVNEYGNGHYVPDSVTITTHGRSTVFNCQD